MKRHLIATLSIMGMLSVGFLLMEGVERSTPGDAVEERVNANLIRVHINGAWEEFPLMPLAESTCRGGGSLFDRYCTDNGLAPGLD